MANNKRQQLWDKMNKVYGNSGLCTIKQIETLSSGSYVLDDALGAWGLPRGRIIQYAGKESSGKTLMSFMAIKEWQQKHEDNWAVFIDSEFSYDEQWAKRLGVDTDRIFLIKENDGVEIFTQLVGEPHKDLGKPKKKLGLLDMEKEEPTGLGIIVLDSIASVIPPITMTKAVGNTNIAPMGRFLPDALTKLIPLLSQTGVLFIGINQVRVNVGKMFGDPTSTPGGNALKHYCSVMVHFTSSESKDSLLVDNNGITYGHIAGARIDKNKVAPPRKSCKFYLDYFNGVINKNIEIGELAIKYGIVDRPNNRTYKYNDNTWVGKDNFCAAILELNLENELLDKIKEEKLNYVPELSIKNSEESEE